MRGVVMANDHALTVQVNAEVLRPLVVEIIKFFKSGQAPVPVDEMLEVLAFMEAADASKAKGGAEVRLDELK